MRTWLVIGAVAMFACLAVMGLRQDEPPAAGSFEVRVERPAVARPLAGLFGIIPADDLAFNQTSRGAAIGRVGGNHINLSAEGWDFSIEIDGNGRLAQGTRLVFPSWLQRDGRPLTLRCRPDDHAQHPLAHLLRAVMPAQPVGAVGYLRITTQTGADEFSGEFLVALDTCENAESRKAIDWPSAPLTVRGRFERIRQRAGEDLPNPLAF